MTIASQALTTRTEILDRYRRRIEQNERTKLTREERDQLAAMLVDKLVEMNQQSHDDQDAIRQLCEAEKALLEEGYPQSSINSAYLPTYTRLLRAAIDRGRVQLTEQNSYSKEWTKRDGSETGMTQTHYALDFLTYDGATQAQLRSATTAKNNDRQDDLKPVRLDAYLQRVMALLDSQEPEILTIAIAALTGRRHAEVVSVGSFEATSHPYQLRFEGQQKKAQAEAFEIVGLIPAAELLPVFDRFRALPQMQALIGLDDDHPDVQKFNARVNRRVRALFESTGLVPVLTGFKTVSIHRLRALYGAIAIHYFCANNQHLHRFLQNHLGHILTKEVGVGNSRATDHYFHYYLTQEDGTPITARGVKLMAHGALKEGLIATVEPEVAVEVVEPMPIEAIEAEVQPVEAPAEPVGGKRKQGTLRIYADHLDRWRNLLSTVCPECPTQHDKMAAFLEWAENQVSEAAIEPQPQPEPQQAETTQTESELSLRDELKQMQAAFAVMTERLNKLENQGAIAPKPQTRQKPKATKAEGTDEPKPARPGASDRAMRVLKGVQAWNQEKPDDQSFAITLSLLKDEFNINFGAARSFLEDNKDEIAALHRELKADNGSPFNPRSHNRQKGRNIQELKEFIVKLDQPEATEEQTQSDQSDLQPE